MRDRIERLTQRLANRGRAFAMSDGVPLMILGLGIAARGLSYGPQGPKGPVTHPAEAVLPMWEWGVIWVTVGFFCAVAALRPKTRVAAVALGMGVGLNLLWAGSFIAASIIGDMPRGWVTAVGYLSISLLVMWATWRGGKLIPRKGSIAGDLS